MSKLSTLLLAAMQERCQVMTPDGAGWLTNLRLSGSPLATIELDPRPGVMHFRPETVRLHPDLLRPVLKGFVLFRGEVLDGKSEVIGPLMQWVINSIGTHKLEGVFSLACAYDMSKPCIETPLGIEAQDVVAPSDLGRVRITEDLRIYWQPSNSANAELSAEDMTGKVIEQADLGWFPLHISGLREWFIAKGYAAELPVGEYITPMTANMLTADAALRQQFFHGITSN
jgi:hypothetical protein